MWGGILKEVPVHHPDTSAWADVGGFAPVGLCPLVFACGVRDYDDANFLKLEFIIKRSLSCIRYFLQILDSSIFRSRASRRKVYPFPHIPNQAATREIIVAPLFELLLLLELALSLELHFDESHRQQHNIWRFGAPHTPSSPNTPHHYMIAASTLATAHYSSGPIVARNFRSPVRSSIPPGTSYWQSPSSRSLVACVVARMPSSSSSPPTGGCAGCWSGQEEDGGH